MGETSLPKLAVLFGEKKKRSTHGPRKHWSDLVSDDLTILALMDGMNCFRIGISCWYQRYQEGTSQLSPFVENLCSINNQSKCGPFTC